MFNQMNLKFNVFEYQIRDDTDHIYITQNRDGKQHFIVITTEQADLFIKQISLAVEDARSDQNG